MPPRHETHISTAPTHKCETHITSVYHNEHGEAQRPGVTTARLGRARRRSVGRSPAAVDSRTRGRDAGAGAPGPSPISAGGRRRQTYPGGPGILSAELTTRWSLAHLYRRRTQPSLLAMTEIIVLFC